MCALPGVVLGENPTLTDPTSRSPPVVTGLNQPTCMAFLGPNDFLINEKASGQVKRVTNGVVAAVGARPAGQRRLGARPAGDRPAPAASPRTRASISTGPRAAPGPTRTSCREVGNPNSAFPPGTPQPAGEPGRPLHLEPDAPDPDLRPEPDPAARVPARREQPGRALQQGNHNSGQIRFGPDGKIYIQIGDNGRRGWLQNLPNGPFLPPRPTTSSAAPRPDDNHSPADLPAQRRRHDPGRQPVLRRRGGVRRGGRGEHPEDLLLRPPQRLRPGLRPAHGQPLGDENGDDAFDEINKVVAGGNYGWIQIDGAAQPGRRSSRRSR